MARQNKNKSLGNYLAIGSMGASIVLKNLPYVLFLSFLTVVYIANAHFAERQVRRIQTLQKEVKELKRQYNSLKSEIMYESRLSEIGEEVEALGLRKSTGRVKRIELED
jgi:FtsZ-binding cell division protein ZapB